MFEGYDYIRELPQVKRILESDLFQEIHLIRFDCSGGVVLNFNVVAPDLLPHPRARLLEAGMIKRHNVRCTSQTAFGVSLNLQFFECALMVNLYFLKADIR